MGTEQRIRPTQARDGTTVRTAGATTMQAIVQDSYGDDAEDVLCLAEIDRPVIGDDEVLVRVHAAGVDRGVWHLMTGLPYPLRLMGYGVRAPSNRVRGREVAGRVEAVGKDVTTLQPGDEVFGIAEGSFAEYACARADKLAPKPKNLTFELAAAAGVSSLTALQAVRDRGQVQPGQKVLVIGASGGVGTFAVQIAKAFGADVTGVCSTAKTDMVRSLGADHVLDYTRDDIADGGQRYDVVLDTGGNRSLTHLRRALTPRGTLVIVGGETGSRWLGGIDRALRAPMLSAFVGQKLGGVVTSENAEDLIVLTDLIESGKVTPVVERTYPLADAPAAVRYMADGHARGKVVVTVATSIDGTSSDNPDVP
jgi:NADPH:quinone reductase and related Zn-dependent oxidoreductases